MRLTMVGHASVVVEEGDVVLLTDPWLLGDAFNESWAQWPAPRLGEPLLARITHLWISHEHPDHLSIPTLRWIAAARADHLTVLYQRHWQPQTATFLRSLGFRDVLELTHAVPVALSSSVEVTLHQVGHEDSALIVRGPRHTLLNLNDCKPSPGTLRRLTGSTGHVDVLLDQFSIAGWPGNPDDTERMAGAREHALETFAKHVEVVEPRWVVPFASSVRFSHEENEFMNTGTNRVHDAVAAAGQGRGVALYPGDVWDVGGDLDPSANALDKYAADDQRRSHESLKRHDPVPFEKVLGATHAWMDAISSSYHGLLLRRMAPCAFSIDDLQRTIVIDCAHSSACELEDQGPETSVHLSSQAAWYTFAHRWGMPTLMISGRFRLSGPEGPFRRLKQLGSAYSTGIDTRHLHRTLMSRRMGRVAWTRRRSLVHELAGRLR